MTQVPADVYEAARRVYLGTSGLRVADEAIVLMWAMQRWERFDGSNDSSKMAFWILSQAARDGHQP